MKKPNILYKLLVTSFTISSFSEGIILPIYAIFVQKVGGDILDAGLAMGIFLITEGLFTMIIHRFKWSLRQRHVLMVLGWVIWLGGICMYLFISNIWTLFLAQVLTGLGNAIADPIFEEELAAHTDKGLEELEWGLFDGSLDVINGAAAIIGAGIAFWFGFTVLIYLMIATASISLFLILIYNAKVKVIEPEFI